MRERNNVVKMITLISQIGITMLSSIFVCGLVGYLLDNRFGWHTFPFLLILGIAGGYRAIYSIVKQFISKSKQEKGPLDLPDGYQELQTEEDQHDE